MKTKPFLSIITINYNNKDGLKKTIESEVGQNWDDYEHIIIDGGSTDGSVEVIKEALENDVYASHVSYWCSEKDGGIYPAMNKGIRHASGEFVYMLNSGDALYPNMLSLLSPYLQQHKDAVVYGAVDCSVGGSFVRTACFSAECLDRATIPHQAAFVPISYHERFGLYDESYKICGDRHFFCRLKKQNISFVHVPLIVCDYDESGISTTSERLTDRENIRISHLYFSQRNRIFFVLKKLAKLMLPGFVVLLLRRIVKVKRIQRGGVLLHSIKLKICLDSLQNREDVRFAA